MRRLIATIVVLLFTAAVVGLLTGGAYGDMVSSFTGDDTPTPDWVEYENDKLQNDGDAKNDYNFVKLVGHEKIEGVFNGEKGSVVKILPDPENDSYKLVIQFDDGSFGGYTKASAQNLTLAYATTLHKCQGSEAACMIMGYTYGDYILMNRSLFYTGETRAKKEFRFYGEEKWKYGRMLSAFDVAVGKTDDSRRHTALSERIVNYE